MLQSWGHSHSRCTGVLLAEIIVKSTAPQTQLLVPPSHTGVLLGYSDPCARITLSSRRQRMNELQMPISSS
jgi:hypothetical protein